VSLPLFDPPPAPMEVVIDRMLDAAREVSHEVSPLDVIKRVQHKAGTFYHLGQGGVVEREYWYVVLMNGQVFVEFTDNRERRAEKKITREVIDWMISVGTWREVSA
jgi:hypothetical protein